ncbi:MAG TPA: hypothetical protein VFU89_06340 [Rhabdochlamydiaceae bacterium]|nr:hypothetical protein [Rhabdochlamydiaceae bacterium]
MSICSRLANLPIISHISSFCERVSNITKKDENAAREVQAAGVLIGAGTVFGLFGRCTIMLALGSFSIPSLLFWGAVGATAGALVSSPIVHSFLSAMTTRERQ